MKRTKIRLGIQSTLFALSSLFGCNDAFLEVRPDKALLVPSTLTDFRALMDNLGKMNQSPYLNLVGSDELQSTDAAWAAANTTIRNTYIWAPDLYEGAASGDWNIGFEQIFYANVVLDGLEKSSPVIQAESEYSHIKGTALFHRAMSYFQLSQNFTLPYTEDADKTPGLPIRLRADVNLKPQRGTLEATYQQMLSDLNFAITLLPEKVTFKSRPNRSAAYALLARLYLIMGNYELALKNSSDCIAGPARLLDYNDYPATESSATKPFPKALPYDNEEILFLSQMVSASFLTSATTTTIEPGLLASYKTGDRRRAMFFVHRAGGVVNFKGTYLGVGQIPLFSGIALDEVYLIRAECHARLGHTDLAMQDLNTLLRLRWNTGAYINLTASDDKSALRTILEERKKELVFRGMRWSDLKRLNLEPEFASTLKRTVQGRTYTLNPGDQRYALPLPDSEIHLADLEQNPR